MLPFLVILPVQRVDVAEGDLGHLEVPERRPDVVRQHALVIARGARPLAREMFALEAVGQLVHGGCRPRVLDVGQGITALIDNMAQPLGLGAGIGRRPAVAAANGDPALAPALGQVVEHEAPGARAGDARAEARHLVVVVNLVAIGRRRQATDRLRR